MTKEEAIRNHRKMWSWLAKNPGKGERDYLREFDPEAKLTANCYLCGYVNNNGHCEYCPLEWPGAGHCTDTGGLYREWAYAMDWEDYALAAEIAKQIAELPEKKEIK